MKASRNFSMTHHSKLGEDICKIQLKTILCYVNKNFTKM